MSVLEESDKTKFAPEPLFGLLIDTQKSLVDLASALMHVAFWNWAEESHQPRISATPLTC